ncbi:hypothetical protein FHL15_004945 [Xylaria flabelliformis]|uniref:Uncharacterized protein n=1 Tax=Xylaria flabelliformis TaxID=2512241 RepID=A0A553I1X2_9PEZI|nr:hypothetical protein FHL15_004945 [Xylaria flabelliformis]
MIRQPFSSALGRTRADLGRVTEGIAASLRAFSTAQQLAAGPQDGINSSSSSPRPTKGQRAAAAFSDLVGMNNEISPRPPPQQSNTVFRKLDLRSEAAPLVVPSASSPGGSPNIIRGGIRGGFRGRGGFGAAAGRGGRGGGGLGGGPARRGRGGGGGRSARGGGGGGRGGRGQSDREARDEENKRKNEWSPEVVAMREAKERGSLQQFDPSISIADLVGWGPAVATANSSFARDETVLRQARILGGGQAFHPLHTQGSEDMWTQYNKGTGVFFPTEEVKKWSAEAMGLEAFPPVPKETKDAVLQDALLGTYEGPQYAELGDTLGVVQNYVKRDASWNADAQRRIEAKIKSLLPGGRTGPANPADGARTSP